MTKKKTPALPTLPSSSQVPAVEHLYLCMAMRSAGIDVIYRWLVGWSCQARDLQDNGTRVDVHLWWSPSLPADLCITTAFTLGRRQLCSAAHQYISWPAQLCCHRTTEMEQSAGWQPSTRQICCSVLSSVNWRPTCSSTSSLLGRWSHSIARRHWVSATLAPYINYQLILTRTDILYENGYIDWAAA